MTSPTEALFTVALGLTPPWQCTKTEFPVDASRRFFTARGWNACSSSAPQGRAGSARHERFRDAGQSGGILVTGLRSCW